MSIMKQQMFSIILLLFIMRNTMGQVGNTCTNKYTGLTGICQISTNCPNAKREAALGIFPTICNYTDDATPIVCCDEEIKANENSFLNLAFPSTEAIVYPEDNNNENTISLRISEQKCIEYSKPTIEEVQILALVANAEPHTIDITKCDNEGVPLIIGGTPADLGEFPFMAAIAYVDFNNKLVWICGGTLISEQFVLTAAHCLIRINERGPLKVRLGDLNLNSDEDKATPIDFDVEKYIKHPNFVGNYKYNDIALLKLKGTVKFTKNIRPACLSASEKTANLSIATGWGVTDFGDSRGSDKLLKVTLNVYDNSICNSKFQNVKKLPKGIIDKMICAGDLKGTKDTCQGDSGGPLLVTKEGNQCIFYVIGVTSFGKSCATPDIPAIYTRVSSYISWIERTVWN